MESLKKKFLCLIAKVHHTALIITFIKWIALGSIVGVLSGTASAIFLASLEFATNKRLENPWILFLLPLGGALVSFLYFKFGKNSIRGNNLILEQIHESSETIPLRMAPLVLLGTFITHLFGGSAGREGTAIQMGGSLAEWAGSILKVNKRDRKILLMSGISSGFGSVFGTPLAGTVFGMEVIAIGTMNYEALIPCFTASFVGNIVTHAWGIHHTMYKISGIPEISYIVVLKVIFASILFGLASILFSELTHKLKKVFGKYFKNTMIKSAAGAIVIIALVYILGTREYLGLGVSTISKAFEEKLSPLAFLWKTIFTAITLGSGFQGGEVTPLFFIGSTLGNALSQILNLAPAFLAALGFIAVFSGATNTPIACFVMGIELFGAKAAVYLFMACIVSYVFSGHHGIYSSQRIFMTKSILLEVPEDSTLESIKKNK